MQQDLQLIEWKSFKQTASVDIPDKTWMDINEIKYTSPQYDVVKSMGFKIGETDDIITLASSIKNGLANGITAILKQNIISQVLMGKQPKLDDKAYTKVIEDKIKSGNLTIGTTATITRPSGIGLNKKTEKTFKKCEGIDEQAFIEAYNNGLTYEELAEFFEVSVGTINTMRAYCESKGEIIPRGRGYNFTNMHKKAKEKSQESKEPKLHKLRQYVKDNYMVMTYGEMAQDYGTSITEIQSTVDGLVRDKIIQKWGKPFHGTVCINRDPLIAYGVDVDEWCGCFQHMQDWQMVMRFKVPQSSVRPISDAILQHYPNGREMLYPERKSKLF